MTTSTSDQPLDLFGSESPLDLADQFSFIDVSLEDDSLLPPPSGAKSFSISIDTSSVQESLSRSRQEETFSAMSEKSVGIESATLSEDPLLKNKKKTGFNLRKSIAWNNAFLTEDGVLDCEELSLVNTTFHTLHEREKTSGHGQSKQISKLLKPVMIPKVSFSSISSQKVLLRTVSEQKFRAMPTISSPSSSVASLHGSELECPEHRVSNGHGTSGLRLGVPKQPLASKQKPIASSQIGVAEAVALPRKNGADKRNFGDANGAIKQEQKETSVSFTFQSISTKGSSQPKPAGVNKRLVKVSGKTEVNKNQKSTFPFTTAYRRQHVSSTAKPVTVEKSDMMNTDRPSGLRMPSPKLGFFDMSRLAAQVATSTPESGAGEKNVSTMNRLDVSKKNNGSKIPAPFLNKSRQQIKEPSVKAGTLNVPGSLHNVSNTEISPLSGALQETSTTRPSLNLRASPRHLMILDSEELENPMVLQAKSDVDFNIYPFTKSTDLCSVRDLSGQENSSPDFHDAKGVAKFEKPDDQDVKP